MPKLDKQEDIALEQAKLVKEMANSSGWKEVVEPWLREKLNQSFPDPASFKTDKEFNYAAKTASVFKKVIAEILMFIEQEDQTVKYLNKKKFGKVEKNFQIGK